MLKRAAAYLMDGAEGRDLAITLFTQHGDAALVALDELTRQAAQCRRQERVLTVARREVQELLKLQKTYGRRAEC